ncbi:Ni/Fe hydrogenase subunit alpha [Candidatus Fermentibacterales bacterium]|nr:Ni/Fe hydrogenase subunit alpha [Candidatus Fermentibacterales bacterium]
MSKRISIDPITRLEGHGRIEIFLDDNGDVENVYFQVPELRGFEKFCEGHPVEELARITTRICGVCPEAHHMASAKAADAVYKVEIPPTAKKLRELLYSAFFVTDHATHFYILGGPDFIMGPDADPKVRNILGVIGKVGEEIGLRVINTRHECHRIIKMLGGRTVHPVCAIPGGISKALTEEEREEVEAIARRTVEFGKFSLDLFDDMVLGNKAYLAMIRSDAYSHRTHSIGTVDENNHVNFYDGQLRVVDTEGEELARFHPSEYLDHLAERVEPWTYLKFPYLKKVGWKGLVDGQDSGVYKATPLSRLNAADGMATPMAQEAYDKMFSTLGGKPVHATLATHWARLVEMMYAAERLLELATDPEITSTDIRAIPKATPSEGVGCVEAPRGTLIHHYTTDERGLVRKVNLIVGTTNNNAAICMSLKKAAQKVIRGGAQVSEGLLNLVEMAFRAYDPCLACATHSLPGDMPLVITIHDSSGQVVDTVSRD